ncbi:putative membrane protein [Murinocardiopsis flavida]|uniref:Putative membrane protein n=1 Tax=Murinocardiopsis flavida TaxID=645275 RepID=A0A2P8DE51_9ACTN|nr:glycosyltransferase 87 family protein [Murinocardiopsis flavida]PSK95498.1 putative membrane protein [Murinocardiopsis flavida]
MITTSDTPGHPGAGDADSVTGTSRRSAAAAFPWLWLTAIGLAGAVLGYLVKLSCRTGGWWDGTQNHLGCYSDIYPLYFRDGLDTGTVPYLDKAVEYPVLIGAFMHLAARAVAWLPDEGARALGYFDLSAAVLGGFLVAAVLSVGFLVGRGGVAGAGRPFDRTAALVAGAFTALVPAAFMTAYINWDLMAVALLCGGIAVYARGRQWSGGVLIGLAVAAKFYPFLVFGPLFVLLARHLLRRWRGLPDEAGATSVGDFLRPLGGAAAAWAAVNVPVLVAAPAAWATFFTFSRERPADWGSVYFALGELGLFDTGDLDRINFLGTAQLVVVCAGVALLAVLARRRPSWEQLILLVVAGFLITNKVWSPQFVLWLLPLAVLAWPRSTMRPWVWAAVLGVWQLAEYVYINAIWALLAHFTDMEAGSAAPSAGFPAFAAQAFGFGDTAATIDGPTYAIAQLVRMFSLVIVCAFIVVDCLRNGDSKA